MVEREFNNRTSLIVDPPDGKIPPLTPEAQQRRAAVARATGLPPARESEFLVYLPPKLKLPVNIRALTLFVCIH